MKRTRTGNRTISRALLGALALLAAPALAAVATPTPQAGGGTLVLRGGTVHTLADGAEPIDSGVVVVRDGRIAAVGGPGLQVSADADVMDTTGLHLYPGLFDAVTRLGLTEIGAVDVTSDFRELGDNNPHLQAATAVHPASALIPVTRANGITHAVAAPSGPGLAGQGSLINLDGWTIEEMLIDPGVYMVATWPSLQTRGFDFATRQVFNRSFREAKKQYDEQIAAFEQLLQDARRYDEAAAAGELLHRDQKLEALARVTRGEQPLLINVSTPRSIRDAIAFGERNGVRVILAGAADAWKVAGLIAEKGVPVILGPTQALPSSDNDPYDARYTQPAKLHEAGVRFAISTFNASSARTLPYEAGQAVAFGLPHDEGVKAITRYPAEILGVGDRLGTIEEGKIANLIAVTGDPLEITSETVHLVIAGRLVNTDNKHRRLYEKYRARPRRAVH